LVEIDVHLEQASSELVCGGAKVDLSDVEADLVDIEGVDLVGVGASLVRVDALLSDVGVGTGTPTLTRIPLPTAGVSHRSKGVKAEGECAIRPKWPVERFSD
jgi:hypothetical protein